MISHLNDKLMIQFLADNFLPLQVFVAEITDNPVDPIDVSNLFDLNSTACPYPTTVSNLVPGPGLPASVNNLGSLGSPSNPYYTQKVIARWSTPNEGIIGGMIDTTTPAPSSIRVCLPAFHPNGIARVDFIIKPATGPTGFRTVTSQTMDLESGVPAYCVNVNSADVPPGSFDVEAVAVPQTAGIPRYLHNSITSENQVRDGEHSLTFYNNRATAMAPQRFPRKVVHVKTTGRTWRWDRNNPALPPTIFPACGTQADPCDTMASALEATTYYNYLAGLGTHSIDGGIVQFDDAGPYTFGYDNQTYGTTTYTDVAPFTVQGYGIRETILNRSAQIPGMPGSTWGGPTKLYLKNLTLKPPRIGEGPIPSMAIVMSPTGGGTAYSAVVAEDVHVMGRGRDPSDCYGRGEIGGFMYSFGTDMFIQSIRGNPSFTNHVRTFITHIAGIVYSNSGGLFNSGADYIDHTVSTLCGLNPETSPHGDLWKLSGTQHNVMGINFETGIKGVNWTQGFFAPDAGIHDIYLKNTHFRIGPPNGSTVGAALRLGPTIGLYTNNAAFKGGILAYSVYDPTIPAVYNPNHVYQNIRFISSFDNQALPNPDGANGAITQSNMGPVYTGPSGVTYTQ